MKTSQREAPTAPKGPGMGLSEDEQRVYGLVVGERNLLRVLSTEHDGLETKKITTFIHSCLVKPEFPRSVAAYVV